MCRSPEGFHGPGKRIRFDTEGMLRRVHFGEGKYQEMVFFTDGKPTPGDPGVTSTYKGAIYLFASKAGKTQFEGNPEKYVPQFGGFCAYGAALGALFPVDINTWQVRDGKLYLNLNPAILAEFNKDPAGLEIAGSPNVPVCEPARVGSSRRSTSGSSMSPKLASRAPLWPPTANKWSRSPSGPRERSKTATSAS